MRLLTSKSLWLLAWIIFSFKPLSSRIYYVSSSGLDTNSGRNIGSPFRSIQRCNQLILQAGDSILFKRGEVFYGCLELKQSGIPNQPIVVSAYGSGPMPVLKASVQWPVVFKAAGIARVMVNNLAGEIKQVYWGNKPYPLCRFPDSGYLTMSEVNGTESFFSGSLQQAAGYWDSSTAVVRTQHWVLDKRLVRHSAGGTVELYPQKGFHSSYPFQKWAGFFFQGTRSALSEGEFYADAELKCLDIADASIPLQSLVEVPVYDHVLKIARGQSHIVLSHLQLEKSKADLLYVENASFITVSHCEFRFSGKDAIGGFHSYASSNSNFEIRYSNFYDVGNVAINLQNSTGMFIHHNQFKRIGLYEGLGEGYDSGYSGIFIGKHNTVEYNHLDSIGYSGIVFGSMDTIRFNYVAHYGLVKSDAGGIYCWSGSYNHIEQNLIVSGRANASGTIYPEGKMSAGIYIDDHSHHCTILRNTCLDNDAGILLHNAWQVHVKGNILYDNRTAQLELLEGNPFVKVNAIQELFIQENTFMCMHPSQLAVKISTSSNNVQGMAGTWQNNQYAMPFSQRAVGLDVMPASADGNYTRRFQAFTLDQWKKSYPYDAGSLLVFSKPIWYATAMEIGPELIPNGTFEHGKDWWWTYGTPSAQLQLSKQNKWYSNALQCQPEDSLMLSEINMGIAPIPLKKEATYRFCYRVYGTKFSGFQVQFNQTSEPYTSMVLPYHARLSWDTSVQQDTLWIQAIAAGNASLVINASSWDGTSYWDDVSLKEVALDTNASKPHNQFPLLFNASPHLREYHLPSSWKKLNGEPIPDPVRLLPFQSLPLRPAFSINLLEPPLQFPSKLVIHPNPSQGKVLFQSPESIKRIVLSTTMGQRLEEVIQQQMEAYEFPPELPDGVYVLSIETNLGVQQVRVLKQ
ncbi:MAG: right-handed parallel beta-helix repeat-containing protein [Cytophagaceae bacterium]|nr:right-handed parallel beta-helix repeat-containing protein [Cytophagaceae bacterium]